MDTEKCIAQLERNLLVFNSLLQNPTETFTNWRPEEGKWNLKEILVHLYDEEREDFRARLLHIVYKKEGAMKPIDPEKWVTDRAYNKMDYQAVLTDFLNERKDSVSLLRGISEDLWNLTYSHPHYGEISAKFYLENWVAHDQLHIRQIIRQEYLFLRAQATHSIEYAGKW